jgi:hypothetical protein
MALAVHRAPALPTGRRASSWLWVVGVISACVAAFAALVPPALAAGPLVAPSSPVSVRIVGRLSTAGLPATPAVSLLQVRNDGTTAISWSARSSLAGVDAHAVRIETWVPIGLLCTALTQPLTSTDWSRVPLPAGGSTGLCVRVSATGAVSGLASPSVTVAARPASI